MFAGLAAGATSLLNIEALTSSLSLAARQRLGIARRVPDTTLRDLLIRLEPAELVAVLHRFIRAAIRSKSLLPAGLPWGIVSMDGKQTNLPVVDDKLLQRQTGTDPTKLQGALRTITCSLISSLAKVVVHASVVPAAANEMSHFQTAFDQLRTAFPKLFRLVCYDAGACSEANARYVVDCGYHYLFGLKGTQPTLMTEAERILTPRDTPDAMSIDTLANNHTVTRCLYITSEMSGFFWSHLKTVIRIESRIEQNGTLSTESRYFVSSLPLEALSPKQWLLVIRNRWAVENQAHHTLDAVFREDEHPIIEQHPVGALNVLLLRRITLSVLTLFRSMHLRSEESRSTPWRTLLRWVELTLLQLTSAEAALPRRRSRPAARAPTGAGCPPAPRPSHHTLTSPLRSAP